MSARGFKAATCEYCGGIVSHSLAKGDTSRPFNENTQSACARFFHTECQESFERMYVRPCFRGERAEEIPQ